MKISATVSSAARVRRATIHGLAAVSALALTAVLAGSASAQETDPSDQQAVPTGEPSNTEQDQQQKRKSDEQAGEEIVVTGIRRGIADSLDIKKSSTSIVEAVSAEDIGKLPDVSIAESIARLPGLAAQRVNGRAQVISLRGLSPDFTTTLLNGRQQASSGDNRAVEFDQYPSELLASVVIYKTPDAAVAGMGLSGTADLRTVRPLEFGKRAIALNIRGELNDMEKLNDDVRRWGGRASVSYIDQFANGSLGIALGYAHLDSPSQTRHFKTYGFDPFTDVPGAVTPTSANDALFVNGQEAFATSRQQIRDAGIGIVEWQPSDVVHSTLDVYYSTFKQRETSRGAQWFSNAWADNATFTDVEAVERGGTRFAASGVQNNVVPIVRNDYNKRDDELFAIGLNNEFQLNDRLTFVADLSYSRNHRHEQIMETYAGYGLGAGGVTSGTPDVGRTFDSIGFSFPEEGFPTYDPGLNYADASQVSLGDRAPWGGWAHDGAIRFPDVIERVRSIDTSFQYDSDGFIDGLDLGINYTWRNKDKTVVDNDLFLKNGRQQVLVDPSDLIDPTVLDFVGFGPVLSVDFSNNSTIDKYYDIRPIRDANYFDKSWKIREDLLTFYAKADLSLGNLRGNVGVQVVDQFQKSSGIVIQGDPVVPIPRFETESYTDILPSLNLIYDLGGGHRLRFAASKVMARPRMDQMRANLSPSFGLPTGPVAPGTVLHPWTASGGNPHLKPWRALGLDAAYEWYIDRASYISIAAFYKKLDTYIYDQHLPFNFSGIPIPAGAVIPDGAIISNEGVVTRPANGNGGEIKGLEFSGAIEFGRVLSLLDGFGFLGSLSITDSNLNPTEQDAPGTDVRIPGLSGTVYNLTGYYEKGGFQARASYRYRSAFKGEVVQLFATRGAVEILADRQVDAQIGYTFPEGTRLSGFGMLLQVNNLTDSPYRTRLGLDAGGTHTANGGALLETYEKYGRQFLLGFNYRF